MIRGSKVFKFMISIAMVTLAALIYVHQQVELVKISYAISTKEMDLEDMLDRRESLGYNIKELESPSRLERVLVSRKIDIAFPKRDHVVKVASLPSNAGVAEPLRRTGIEKKAKAIGILKLFGLDREAQAKEK